MRKRLYVPMITLCLLLCGCGENKLNAEAVQKHYQEMAGCSMEAVVRCTQDDTEWSAVLRCDYVPGETGTVEVLSPETIAGIRAVFDDANWWLEYEDVVLPIGPVSRERLSPAICLPFMVKSLQKGWILEENPENWNDRPCYRITVDQSGAEEKILTTLWILQDDMTPLRGEVAVGGEIILTAEFTSFSFYDTIEKQGD